MAEVEIDGLRIAYERAGRGPALVLLHGFFGDARVWHPQFDDLSDEYDLIAWDTPGCGRSSDPPETFRMRDYARCLDGLIDRLRLKRPYVLGLSFGSTLALEVYHQNPARAHALILAGAYAGWTGSLPAELVEQRRSETIRDLDLPREQVVARYNSPGLLSDSAPATVLAANARIVADFHPPGMKAMVRALAEADLRAVLPRIGVPTLLLYGNKDVRSPLSVGEDLHAQIPGSQLVVISGAGHVVNLEAPGRFNAEIRRFLGSLGN